MIDQTIYEAIRSFDLEHWLVEHGADAGDREWVLDCPKCGKHNLTVNTDKRVWHCWTCQKYEVTPEGKRKPVDGAGGLIKLVQWLEGVDRGQALERIRDRLVFSYRDVHACPEELPDRFDRAAGPVPPITPPEDWQVITQPTPFMERRGITMADVAAFGLGWCPTGRYANRLIFPVWENRQLVYFQARAMWASVPGQKSIKSLNPRSQPGSAVSSELLMNLEQAAQYPRVAIVEGPTDLVRTGPDAVCTFGKAITQAQIGRLMRAGVRAIDLLWDADARAEMLAVAPLLQTIFDTRLVFLPGGDPGDYPRSYLTAERYQAAFSVPPKILRV